jgi:hypothetical protein
MICREGGGAGIEESCDLVGIWFKWIGAWDCVVGSDGVRGSH